jgi:hypothetical protein
VEKRDLKVGDVVQLSPETCRNRMFAGCFLTVLEPKSFGCQGYVQSTGDNGEPGDQAYYRPGWDEMEFVGAATFVVG